MSLPSFSSQQEELIEKEGKAATTLLLSYLFNKKEQSGKITVDRIHKDKILDKAIS